MTNIKIFSTIAFAVLLSSVAFSQGNYTDVIYLKNGGIIHGMIIEQIPNQSIKIQTKDKNIFVFKMEEVDRITKEGTHARTQQEQPGNTSKNTARYIIWFESGIGLGVSDSTTGSMTMCGHAVNGVLLDDQFAMGVGVGFDINNTDLNSFFTTTFFIDLRYSAMKKDISPLVVAQFGFATDNLSAYDYTRSGMLFNGGIGGRFKIGTRSAINLTLNYKFQDLRVVNDYYNNSSNNNKGDYKLHYIGITFGVSL